MIKINKHETQLVGGIEKEGNRLIEDKISQRINYLIKSYLILIAKDKSGWTTLYKDPEDGRYWELTYPESENHGGGMPMLTNLLDSTIYEKYNIIV